MDRKVLMEKIDEFDDAVWVAGYGSNPKFSRETLKEVDAREKDEMLLSYWKLMSELLNEESGGKQRAGINIPSMVSPYSR